MRKLLLLAITSWVACGGFAQAHTYSHRHHRSHAAHAGNSIKSETSGHFLRASWYGGGEKLSARTANGERFVAGGLTAAHRSLPFGTRIRVTNVQTGRSAVVRVNDRGPAASTGRSLDLARGAARAIGLQSVGRVRMVVL
jgi:rare lipoprotein A